MKHRAVFQKLTTGFTLIEVMVVIVIIGLMASVVQFSVGDNKAEQLLETESQRFAAVFNTAADYSLLNNLELGLVVEDNTYQFLGYDGKQWKAVSDNKILEAYTLPEDISITLTLDDLPLDEPPLINILKQNEESELAFSGSELNKEKKLIPQVYILSGGDLTPFNLRFEFSDPLDESMEINYRVTALYSTPVEIKGPLQND